MAFLLLESEIDRIRVLDRNRKPLGYVDVERLKESQADSRVSHFHYLFLLHF